MAFFLSNFYVLTYLMRALRIAYAFDLRRPLRGPLFAIMQNEMYCVYVVLALSVVLYAVPTLPLGMRGCVHNCRLLGEHLRYRRRFTFVAALAQVRRAGVRPGRPLLRAVLRA